MEGIIKKALWDQLSLYTPPAVQDSIPQPIDVPELQSVPEDADDFFDEMNGEGEDSVDASLNTHRPLTGTVSTNSATSGGLFYKRQQTVSEEPIFAKEESLVHAGIDMEDMKMEEVVNIKAKDVAEYCLPMVVLHFQGQTSKLNDKDSDVAQEGEKKILDLRKYLKMLDTYLRHFEKVTDFHGDDEEYKLIIRLIACKRYRKNAETVDECYNRLMEQSERFVKIYHKRGIESEVLATKCYWGTRQQMLAGKVIGDWVDRENGPLDPIFGVALQPTAGRVGPGDTGWVHDLLFDDRGHMAYHAAVHDAFGYLKSFHDCGPGYDYLQGSIYFDTTHPLAGQWDGIAFWKEIIRKLALQEKVLNHLRY